MTDRTLPTPNDAADRKLLADVAEHGWHIVGVLEDKEGPGFAFSVGLYHTFGHPEVLFLGLPWESAGPLINDVGEAIRAGDRFKADRRYDDLAANCPLAFVTMDNRYYGDYLGYATWFYRGYDFPVLQCVCPDRAGRFPWDDGYDERHFERQRLLSDPAAGGWPFSDPRNLATFTTRQVIREGRPILHVCHDHDGSWQFLPGGRVKLADALIVCLAAMLRHDPGLADVASLPRGYRARRKAAGEKWRRSKKRAEPE
jgi:hypothetical protein